MSELKAFYVGLGQYSEDGSPCVVAFDADKNPRLLNEKVYLKSEADKVIAEKDKEIQRLENLCESYRIDCDNLAIREANAYKDIERDNKQLRHHKYKRCLAMAKWCDTKGDWYYSLGESFRNRVDFYIKWRDKWLELAEKFKEAK